MRTLNDATILKYSINKYCYTFACNQREAVCYVLHLHHRVYTTFSLLSKVSHKERDELISDIVVILKKDYLPLKK